MTTLHQLTITKYEGSGSPTTSFPASPISKGAVYFDNINNKYYRYTLTGSMYGWTLLKNIIDVSADPVIERPIGATTDDIVIYNNALYVYNYNSSAWVSITASNIAGISPIQVDISSGTTAILLAQNGVANSYIAHSPPLTIKGNNSSSATNPTDLTVAQANAMLTGIVYGNTASQIQALAASSYSGALYMANDTGVLYKSNGVTWSNVNPLNNGLNKNYLFPFNGNFETGLTSPWYVCTVPLISSVPSGAPVAGASSVTTFNINSTTPLGGNYSLQMGASVALSAGAGFASPPIAIDSGDQGKLISIKGYYKPTAGTFNFTSTSPTLQIWIWDTVNLNFISLVNPNVFTSGSLALAGTINGQFQATSNMTSFQLVVVCVNSTTAPVTMLFDDIVVTPQIPTATGAYISDPVTISFSSLLGVMSGPTPAPGSLVSDRFTYWREGKYLYGTFDFQQVSPGNSPGAFYYIKLPLGLQIDTDHQTIDQITPGRATVGTASIGNNLGQDVVSESIGTVQAYTANSVTIALSAYSGGYLQNQKIFWDPSNYGLSSAQYITVSGEFRVPIVGWSSGVALSSQVPQGVSGFNYTSATGTAGSLPLTIVAFGTKNFDDGNDTYNPATGITLCNSSGYRSISALISAQSNTTINPGNIFSMYLVIISKGITTNVLLDKLINPSTTDSYVGAPILKGAINNIYFLQGDQYYIGISSPGNTISLNSTAGNSYFTSTLLTSNQAIATEPSVSMTYQSSDETLVGTSDVIIPFSDILKDTHAAYNSVDGIYTTPLSGSYKVAVKLQSALISPVSNTPLQLYVYVNGAAVFLIDEQTVIAGASQRVALKGDCKIDNCIAGSTEISIYAVGGALFKLTGIARENYLSIDRVGN